MGSTLILDVWRKDRFCKIHAIEEGKDTVKYYTNTSNLFDLRDEGLIGIHKETYHSTWDDAWEFFTTYLDAHRRIENAALSKSLPDWLLLDPVYISPELCEWITKQFSNLENSYIIKEYEMGRLDVWTEYLKK